MGNAFFGLIGVVLGVLLTVVKEWWFQSRKDQKDIEYLSIQVACMLERYIAACAEVVSDDGLCYGQYNSEGFRRIQASVPSFEPESLKVEWKALPANFMYEILNFPNHIEAANSRIDSAFENSSPPDYDEGFEERQYQYAQLGIHASKLASKLREYAKLPKRESGDWNPIQHMEEQKIDIDVRREKRAAEISRTMPFEGLRTSVGQPLARDISENQK